MEPVQGAGRDERGAAPAHGIAPAGVAPTGAAFGRRGRQSRQGDGPRIASDAEQRVEADGDNCHRVAVGAKPQG
jgi:hypothetical protein